jgi:hypothetical protein
MGRMRHVHVLAYLLVLLAGSVAAQISDAAGEQDDADPLRESHPRRSNMSPLAEGNPFARAAATGAGVLIHPDVHAQFSATLATLTDESPRPAVDSRPTTPSGDRLTLEIMRAQPVAVWVDSKAKLFGPAGSATVQGALTSAAELSPPPLVVFVLYKYAASARLLSHQPDPAPPSMRSPLSERGRAPLTHRAVRLCCHSLPNRDCAAAASAGEICCVYAADGKRCNLLAQELGCKLGMWEYREQFVRPFARLLAQYEQYESGTLSSRVPVAVYPHTHDPTPERLCHRRR